MDIFPAWIFAPILLTVFMAMILGVTGRFVTSVDAKTKINFWSSTLFGGALVFASCLNLYEIRTSPRLTVRGTVQELVHTTGRGTHSEFDIVGPNGIHHLNAEYTGPNLKDGELVQATYLQYPKTMTDLQVLQPDKVPWVLHESDGTWGVMDAFLFGASSLVYGFLHRPRGDYI